LKRMVNRKPGTQDGDLNRLDANTLAYHQRVRGGYAELAAREPGRWVRVDASQPPDDVQCQLREIVLERLHPLPPNQSETGLRLPAA